MNVFELFDTLKSQESSVQQALQEHGLALPKDTPICVTDYPPILRDVISLTGDTLCDALNKHVMAGEDPDATPPNFSATAFTRCFRTGKLDAMRILINAGAKTGWTADQISIALGEIPTLPDTGTVDPFLFACRVGNLPAARAYLPMSDSGQHKESKAIIEAVHARATDVVLWLLDQGFDPDAVDDRNSPALEHAVRKDDAAMAEVLLAAGACPFGGRRKYCATPVEIAVSDQMRTLFIRFGVNPARFEYDISPEAVALSFLPEKPLTREEFDLNRSRRAGRANPERFLPTFWSEQMRTAQYDAPKDIERDNDRTKPIWTFHRNGRSFTPLPDGRLVLIAGEHEDSYDPDFCIYADVTVLDGKGGVDHFIYPEDVFPPTDFHTATLHDNQIWLIGTLSYADRRQEGVTQVLRLDLTDFSIYPVETSGDLPGWVFEHRACLRPDGIMVTGGLKEPGYRYNEHSYLLDLKTLIWRKTSLSGADQP